MFVSIRLKRHLSLKPLLSFYNCQCAERKIHSLGLDDIPKITAAEIRKLLRQKGFAVQDGFTSLTTKCSLCSDEKPDSKVYVNKTTGMFLNIT